MDNLIGLAIFFAGLGVFLAGVGGLMAGLAYGKMLQDGTKQPPKPGTST